MKGFRYKDQRGMGAMVVIVAVVVIAIIGLVGWRLASNKNTPAKTASTATTAAANTASVNCLKVYSDKDFCKFASSFALTNVSYKVVFSESKGTAGSSAVITYLTDGKGNSSVDDEGVGLQTHVITLDGATYFKDQNSDTWMKYSAGNSSSPTATDPASDIKFDTSAAAGNTPKVSYKKVGQEACGSLTCFKYQFSDPATPNTTDYLWFDTKDYRLQHWSSTDNNGATSDAVFTYQAVTITAPTPVTDASSAASDTPSAAEIQAEQQAAQNPINYGQ